MPQITLSSRTQTAIQNALSNGPGTNNQNNLAAYNDINSDIHAAGGFNSGTLAWFSQAGLVNTEQYSASPAGEYIYNYTISAARSEGVTVTMPELQTVSNTIASTVFQQIKNNGYQFSDSTAAGGFAPQNIVADDAGAGLTQLNALTNSHMDEAVWGGTLFARTELNDPNYFSTYNLNLTPGSADCAAITAGSTGAVNGVLAAAITNPALAINLGTQALFTGVPPTDAAAIKSCFPSQSATLSGPNGETITQDGSGDLLFNNVSESNSSVASALINGQGSALDISDRSSGGTLLSQLNYNIGSSGGLTSSALTYYASSGAVQGTDNTTYGSSGTPSSSISGLISTQMGAGSASLASNADATFSGGGTSITGTTGDIVNIGATSAFTTYSGSGATVNLAAGAGVFESGGKISDNLSQGSSLGIFGGSGYEVNGTNANASGAYNGSFFIGGTGMTAQLNAGSNLGQLGGTTTVTSSTSNYIGVDWNGKLTLASPAVSNILSLDGSGTSVSASSNDVGISQTLTQETIIGNNLKIDVGNDVAAQVYGSNDKVSGGNGDQFAINGTNDPVNANNSYVNYSGTNSGDDVSGTGDSGSDWGGSSGSSGGSSGGGYYGYGYYGFSSKANVKGTNIGVIAQYDTAVKDQADADNAVTGRLEAEQVLGSSSNVGTFSSHFEGPKWADKTITWTVDSGAGAGGTQFNDQIQTGSVYDKLLDEAFDVWAAASGLKFEEVSDPTQADIRIGFTSFSSASSGVLGYTTLKGSYGQALPGATVSLEDPNDLALASSQGQLTYQGTQTTFEQLALHEIGHALGLADDGDPNSIMYPVLQSTDRMLDATDLVGIKTLYGSGAAALTTTQGLMTSDVSEAATTTTNAGSLLVSQADQLVAAMASFAPSTAVSSLTIPTAIGATTMTSVSILSPAH